jgi:hypothetical protein
MRRLVMNNIFWKFAASALVSLVAISWGTREPRSTRYSVTPNNELAVMYRSVGHPPHDLFLIEDTL